MSDPKSDEGVDGSHIVSIDALRTHAAHPAKWSGYRRLLVALGLEPEAILPETARPHIILAEQPGCWFVVGEWSRRWLLERLVDSVPTAPDSGVVALGRDALGDSGFKGQFLRLCFYDTRQECRLVGPRTSRRHRGRMYDALPVAGPVQRRADAVLGFAIDALRAADSPADYARWARARFGAGVDPDVRPLLPADNSRASLRDVGRRLSRCDRAGAVELMEATRRILADGAPSWTDAWARVNGAWLGTPVGRLGPRLNDGLLAVRDPIRLGQTLARWQGLAPGAPVPLAGIRGRRRAVLHRELRPIG